MRLIWYQRKDGLWNADCTCGATCCGIRFEGRGEYEAWHFQRADEDHKNGNKHLPCGPKLPDPDPNLPGPQVFP
jgi:hypothetical protein